MENKKIKIGIISTAYFNSLDYKDGMKKARQRCISLETRANPKIFSNIKEDLEKNYFIIAENIAKRI